MANRIIVHVNCPIDNGNIYDMAANHEVALNLFTNQCPAGARVAEVTGIKGKRQDKCAWRVRYIRDFAPPFGNIDPEQLALEICNGQPNNTTIIKKTRIPFPPAIEIVYSIRCMCDVSPSTGMSIKRSVSVETINTDLVNLKVEENIQE